jgi:hypothetical protein
MCILSEEVFKCHECSKTIVYEPYHTTGIESCRHCGTRHLVKHQKTIIVKYDENLSEQANKANLEIEGWSDWKKEIVSNLRKKCL